MRNPFLITTFDPPRRLGRRARSEFSWDESSRAVPPKPETKVSLKREGLALSMLIKLIRHGESLANVGAVDPVEAGEHGIGLSPLGHEQARQAGRLLGVDFLTQALVY